VRTSFFAATLVAVASFAATTTVAHAQAPGVRPAAVPGGAPPQAAAPGGGPTKHGLAVIDVTYILENYAKLKSAMEYYKSEAQKVEDALKRQRDDIAKRAEGLKALQPGSPEYKKLEEELTKAESDWKLDVASKRRDFAEKESTYYLKAYQELTETVKTYCERTGIQLVLRYNGAPIDPNNREMVQMEVFKMVLHFDKSIDITDIILGEMNRKAGVAAQPRGPAQGQPQIRK
jgi:Skp family chaperone for outer membrane proteins